MAELKEKEKRPERAHRERRAEKENDGIKKTMVEYRRVTKVVKGGRMLRFSVLVVAGDGQGRVGAGMGKSAETTVAIEKASAAAKKNMIKVTQVGTTIPHEVYGVFEKTKVLLKPAREGNGVIAGGAVRTVLEHAGIKDITAKLYGSNNKTNCVYATIDGLQKLKDVEQVAKLRGVSADSLK